MRKRQLLDDVAGARSALAREGDDEGLLDALDTAALYHAGVAQRRADERMRRAR